MGFAGAVGFAGAAEAAGAAGVGRRHDNVLPGEAVLPVLPALRELLPAGGLRRGSVVTTGRWSLLCLALVAEASAAGAWCAVAGLPQLGVAAAVEAGLNPQRMLLVADPGPGWPQVVASLLDGCDLVLLRPPDPPSAQMRRRIEAALRRCGGVLVVAGDWDGAQARLVIARQEWTGIGTGHGRLRARRVQVVADGRGAAARSQARWLWLPGPDGSVTAAGGPPGVVAAGYSPGVVAAGGSSGVVAAGHSPGVLVGGGSPGVLVGGGSPGVLAAGHSPGASAADPGVLAGVGPPGAPADPGALAPAAGGPPGGPGEWLEARTG